MKVTSKSMCGTTISCIDRWGKIIPDSGGMYEGRETFQLLNLEEAAPELALMQLVEAEDVNGQFQTFLF
eukprot:CAMPEP_0168618866 /NCGR_PEP_ID=MMETSP0449_2-20121227/6297_1 /TAXON_ID=1082188 /ORGANISM="Strombidium rassoulzadegani, Strain ras09" /LENGTH=68 /DNA_ID=CAMNT_0008659763 /DNA_START=194 /DNA_END=400 /DNA_ORIENTATION=-